MTKSKLWPACWMGMFILSVFAALIFWQRFVWLAFLPSLVILLLILAERLETLKKKRDKK